MPRKPSVVGETITRKDLQSPESDPSAGPAEVLNSQITAAYLDVYEKLQVAWNRVAQAEKEKATVLDVLNKERMAYEGEIQRLTTLNETYLQVNALLREKCGLLEERAARGEDKPPWPHYGNEATLA